MNVPDEKSSSPLKAAYEACLDSVIESATVGLDFDMCYSPAMTPIEEIAWFTLRRMLADGRIKSFQSQKQIGRYRVDFLIEDEKGKTIVVECDGHDFHERTKDQAQCDKKRDRELQSEGYKVYRFTGSEIFRTSGVCIAEAFHV